MLILPDEIIKKIYIYAHPTLSQNTKTQIKLQAAIIERKYFMNKLQNKMISYYNSNKILHISLNKHEVINTLKILLKCNCSKKYVGRFNKLKCNCKIYIRTLLELLGIEYKYLNIYANTPIILENLDISVWKIIS